MKWQIPYGGTTYEFDDGHLTAGEARLQKRLTDGSMPSDADVARAKMDGDAWIAALVIARRRTGLEQAADIDEDAFVLSDIITATQAAMTAAAASTDVPEVNGGELTVVAEIREE